MHDANATQIPTTAIDEPDASKYIGFSQSYLRQRRMRGEGPAFVRHGRTIRYLVSDLDAWMRAHRIDPQERQTA